MQFFLWSISHISLFPFPISTGTCCTKLLLGSYLLEGVNLQLNHTKDCTCQTSVQFWRHFKMPFKNIWSCRWQSGRRRMDVWSPLSNHIGNIIQGTAAFFDFLFLPFTIPSVKELLYSKFWEARKFMCSFTDFSLIQWIGNSQWLLLHHDPERVMIGNRGLKVNPLSSWKFERFEMVRNRDICTWKGLISS